VKVDIDAAREWLKKRNPKLAKLFDATVKK
jgi:hypothetical protein